MSSLTVRVTEALEKDFDSLEYEINEISYLWTEPGYRLAYRGETVGKEVHEAGYEPGCRSNPGGTFGWNRLVPVTPVQPDTRNESRSRSQALPVIVRIGLDRTDQARKL